MVVLLLAALYYTDGDSPTSSNLLESEILFLDQ